MCDTINRINQINESNQLIKSSNQSSQPITRINSNIVLVLVISIDTSVCISFSVAAFPFAQANVF